MLTTLTIEDTQYRNEVLKMAKEAGLRQHIPFWSDSEVAVALEAFAKLVAEAEREACAKYVEGLTIGSTPLTVVMGAIGDAIRARRDEVTYGEPTSRGGEA
jgi:hypothetical protein